MMTTKDSPVKISDRAEYAAFISECLQLIVLRNRLARAQQADKPCHDQYTAVVRSMRRLIPLARALYVLLPGDDGQRMARKGKRNIWIDSHGHTWVSGQPIAWEE